MAYQRFGSSLIRRLDESGVPPAAREQLVGERMKLAAAVVSPSLSEDLRRAARSAIESAFVDAFRLNMLLAAALAVAGALCAWLLIDPGRPIGRKPDG